MSGLILARQGRLSERRGGADNFIDFPPPGVPAYQSLNRRTLNALKDEDFGEIGHPVEEEEDEDKEDDDDDEGKREEGEERVEIKREEGEEEGEAEGEGEEADEVNALRAQNQTRKSGNCYSEGFSLTIQQWRGRR